MAGKPATGARAILTPDEQREHIVKLILAREWHPGSSHKLLAEEWGVSVRTISQRALEASHAVRVGTDKSNADFIAESLAELDSLAQMARDLGKPRDAAYGRNVRGDLPMMWKKTPEALQAGCAEEEKHSDGTDNS